MPVTSNQEGIHPDLAKLAARHAESLWLQPIRSHNQTAFEALQQRVTAHGGPLVFDSGCGTGLSTVRLAQRHPNCLVIGIDQSEDRLGRRDKSIVPDNCALVRAQAEDIWRLALKAGWHLDRHYLLYPNPWPKKSQLQRRWHGHPVFPTLLALGGRLELRTNWKIYAQEFTEVIRLATATVVSVSPLAGEDLTPFETKYREQGEQLWQISVDLIASTT